MHAAEDDGFGVRAAACGLGELERVSDEIGVTHDLIALVEVAEHDDTLAERCLRDTDALIKLRRCRRAVELGKLALAGRAGGDHVAHRGTGAVAGTPRRTPTAPLRGRGCRCCRRTFRY